jgi:hypothetical protein
MSQQLPGLSARPTPSHGWIGTETVSSRLGDFEFRGGYPAGDCAARLRDALAFNRATEIYLAQMPAVSWYHVWKAIVGAGDAKPNQMVIWEKLMDAETLLLTGNSETVYGLCAIDLKRDGPVVVNLPPQMLGGFSDLWQREIAVIGPAGADKGEGGKFLLLPPDHSSVVPEGYLVARSRTYRAVLGMRGFLVGGRPDRAVALMKTATIYPLSRSRNPPSTTFIDGSRRAIDTLFPDDYRFFEDLAWLIAHEPEDAVPAHERFQLASIGIERFKPFKPDIERQTLLGEAARLGGAIARANSFASADDDRLVYSNRHWEWAFIGGSAEWDAQGYVNTDRRAAFAYMAVGMSPAMVKKIVGGGSQYLFAPCDSSGEFLDGAQSYRLRIPPNIPVKNFWSAVAYDAESRSMLQNGQAFPTVSAYTNPAVNADGAIDIHFGPAAPPGRETNWIRTLPGKGWFVLMRLYGPLDAFFDKSWKPGDIERLD